MTVKNKNLGGESNWLVGGVLVAADLNDTFDELVTRVDAGTGPSPY